MSQYKELDLKTSANEFTTDLIISKFTGHIKLSFYADSDLHRLYMAKPNPVIMEYMAKMNTISEERLK